MFILGIKLIAGIQRFPYIYTERNNIHILDLVQTAQLLKRANSYVTKAASNNKTFLFIGTNDKQVL